MPANQNIIPAQVGIMSTGTIWGIRSLDPKFPITPQVPWWH